MTQSGAACVSLALAGSFQVTQEADRDDWRVDRRDQDETVVEGGDACEAPVQALSVSLVAFD